MNLKVNFLRLHPDAAIPYKKEGHDDDFCYDCVATSVEKLHEGVYRYGLGFALQVDRRDRAIKLPVDKIVGIDIRPRSSIWEHGMMIANTPGTCDEGYTGEYKVVMYHLIKDLPIYKVGDRVCQIKLSFTQPIEFVDTDELGKTVRGDGGFGSTGK